MKISTAMKATCGAYSESLNSEYSFVALDAKEKKLTLTADAGRTAGNFSDAYLTVKLSQYSWKLPLKIDFIKCGNGSEAAKSSTDCAFTVTAPESTTKVANEKKDTAE